LGFQGYLEAARLKQQAAAISVNDEDTTDYRLRSFVVETDSDCKDKTIRDSGIREAYHGMVVGVERGTERILGPRASFTLLEGDLVWIVSDNKKREEAPA
jgi:CPA2 family monovalent cation:H+ antiporter-2